MAERGAKRQGFAALSRRAHSGCLQDAGLDVTIYLGGEGIDDLLRINVLINNFYFDHLSMFM